MHYSITPQVAVLGRETALEAKTFIPDAPYLLSAFPMRYRQRVWQRELRTDAQGRLCWRELFTEPGEYLLDLFALEARRPAATLHLYVLPESLARRWPLRGDFHLHTYYSDGRQPPVEMAVRARELGLDAIAITDHNCYAPSLEAIEHVQRLGLPLICLPGEEVSFSNWHMLSLGTTTAIWDRYNDGQGLAEIAAQEAELGTASLREGMTAAEYALIKWAVRAIHRAGGLACLAHPYWVCDRGRHLDRRFYDQLIAEREIDAVELLGDVDYPDNLLSIAHYQELLYQGYRPPVLGNSDAHNVAHTFGHHWTLLLAAEPTAEGVSQAIRDGQSVACTSVGPEGERDGLRIYGPLELVEYAYFLAREFFPAHDALCQQEAVLGYAALRGEVILPETWAQRRREMEGLYRRALGLI